jgi:hypothetical protein
MPMPTPGKRTQKPKSKDQPVPLKGWQYIAAFLGQPVSVAQRCENRPTVTKFNGLYRQLSLRPYNTEDVPDERWRFGKNACNQETAAALVGQVFDSCEADA